MPETAMNEDYCMVFRQHDIRMSRQLPVMQPVPETVTVQILPDDHLRLRILAPYPGHHPAAGFLVDDIGHGGYPSITAVEHTRDQAGTAALPFRGFGFAVPAFVLLAGPSMMKGFMSCATSLNTGMTTELPNCL